MPALKLGTIDIGGDGKEILLEAIKRKYNYNLDKNDVAFSDPELVTTPSPTHNSFIYIGPKAESGYYGIKKIYYNRIHVSELGRIRIAKGTATKVSELLPAINLKYGILVKNEDIFDEVLPTLGPGQTEIDVTFKFRDTSIVFYGGSKITLGANDPGQSGGNTFPPAGELLHTFCDGVDKKGVYTDGMGRAEIKLISANSSDCGYNPNNAIGVKSQLLIAGTHYTDQAGLTHTSLNMGEGSGWAFASFRLTKALSESVKLKAQVTYNEASDADIEASEVSIGGGNFSSISFPSDITIPAGQTEFTVRFKYKEDHITEGDESFNLSLSKYPQDSKITNTDPLIIKFVIEDTSKAPIVHPAAGTVIGTKCSTGNLYEMVADGIGGSTDRLKEKDSPVCLSKGKAAGVVIKTACDGTTQKQWITDGYDGFIITQTPNSSQCGYQSHPAKDTILRVYCENGNQWFEIADGNGGRTKENKGPSSSCDNSMQLIKTPFSLIAAVELIDSNSKSRLNGQYSFSQNGNTVTTNGTKVTTDKGVSSGKWYWEVTFADASGRWEIGVTTNDIMVYSTYYNKWNGTQYTICNALDHVLYKNRSSEFNYAYADRDRFWETPETSEYGISLPNASGTSVKANTIIPGKREPKLYWGINNGDTIGVALDLVNMRVSFIHKGIVIEEFTLSLAGQEQKSFYPVIVSANSTAQVAKVNFGQEPFVYTPPVGFNKGFGTVDKEYLPKGVATRYWCEGASLYADIATGSGITKTSLASLEAIRKNNATTLASVTEGNACTLYGPKSVLPNTKPTADKVFYLDDWISLAIMPVSAVRCWPRTKTSYPVLLKKSATDQTANGNQALRVLEDTNYQKTKYPAMTISRDYAQNSQASNDVYTLPNKNSYWSVLDDMELTLDVSVREVGGNSADNGTTSTVYVQGTPLNALKPDVPVFSLYLYKKNSTTGDVDYARYLKADLYCSESNTGKAAFKIKLEHSDPTAAIKTKVQESEPINVNDFAYSLLKNSLLQLRATKNKLYFSFNGVLSAWFEMDQSQYKTDEEFIPAFGFDKRAITSIAVHSLYWGPYRNQPAIYSGAVLDAWCDGQQSKFLYANLSKGPIESNGLNSLTSNVCSQTDKKTVSTYKREYGDYYEYYSFEPTLKSNIYYTSNQFDNTQISNNISSCYRTLGSLESEAAFNTAPDIKGYINVTANTTDPYKRGVVYVSTSNASVAPQAYGISPLRPEYCLGELFKEVTDPQKATSLQLNVGASTVIMGNYNVPYDVTNGFGVSVNISQQVTKPLLTIAFTGYDNSISKYLIAEDTLVCDLHFKTDTAANFKSTQVKWYWKIYSNSARTELIAQTAEQVGSATTFISSIWKMKNTIRTYTEGAVSKIDITTTFVDGNKTLNWQVDATAKIANLKLKKVVPIVYWNREIMVAVGIPRFVWKFNPA